MGQHSIGELVGYTSFGGEHLHIGVIYKIKDHAYFIDWINGIPGFNLNEHHPYMPYEIDSMKAILDKFERRWEYEQS